MEPVEGRFSMLSRLPQYFTKAILGWAVAVHLNNSVFSAASLEANLCNAVSCTSNVKLNYDMDTSGLSTYGGDIFVDDVDLMDDVDDMDDVDVEDAENSLRPPVLIILFLFFFFSGFGGDCGGYWLF